MLGVCYYPEHWDRARWREDARRMAALGLKAVRIGEFAWSRLEPARGDWRFDWLDEAIETLAAEGLGVVIGTPTATPPKWLIDEDPTILPVDPATGRVRGFGSRRHYDFASERYLAESLRITEKLARRYGAHRSVIGWQTDNELCCHDTALSASPAALSAFRDWLAQRYQGIDALNRAWGNVFWSMDYRDFSAVELPFGAVTETSPAHRLAFRRYASDRVADWHRRMVETIRRHAGSHQFVTHNFIPMNETGVDCFALAAPLDFASYDNYPLGRTDLFFEDEASFRPYMRTGHPDLSGWYFDQTRCLTAGRHFWVMEQQPGPVNWARHNPRPAPGMVRLWTLEAFAHGASCVSYFRWRQAPFAQEQMHAGLLRPDDSEAEAWPEVAAVHAEIETLGLATLPPPAPRVAMLISAEGRWVTEIERQGDSYDMERNLVACYGALRSLGLDVDIVSPQHDLAAYALIVAPALPVLSEADAERLAAAPGHLVFGPRTGAKSPEFSIPDGLPPGPLRRLLPIRVLVTETLRPGFGGALHYRDRTYESRCWRETLDAGACEILAHYEDGSPAAVQSGRAVYLASLTDLAFLCDFLADRAGEAGLSTVRLPEGVRLSRRGGLVFAFNRGASAVPAPVPEGAEFLLGGPEIGPRDAAIWKEKR
ncbi:MAG: beta-galactosidase [Rhodothalassiaceae bacterium]